MSFILIIFKAMNLEMDATLTEHHFLSGSGEIGIEISQHDWSQHPLGAIGGWPSPLRAALSTALSAGFPSYVAWGEDFHTFYNAAYKPILGSKITLGQGRPLAELWSEIADVVCSMAKDAFSGAARFFEDRPFVLDRHGYPEHTYFTFCLSPIRDEHGTIGGVLGTLIETTEKVAALANLKDSEERYRLALEASENIGTWVVDPKTNITSMDERFAALFEVDAETAKKGTAINVFTERIHPEDRGLVVAAVADAIRTGERYDIDYRIVQRSGKVVWVTAKGKMFTDVKTGKQRFAGVSVEITERKALEDGMHEASRRKDEFLAMLAHELRNPLAPISAAAQLLRTARLDEERIRKTSDVLVRQVEHMTGLVNDLLDVSRVTRGLATIEKAPVEVRKIVADAVEQAAPLIHARRQHLTMELTASSAIVDVDRKRLIQVIANVLNNAAKYTPKDGRICLKTEVQDAHVLIEIIDNGIGMTPEFTARVFDLFTQAHATPDRNSGGLGLGLALVKSLVELHGGSVSARSDGLGQGSRFIIRLPRVHASVESDTATAITSTLQRAESAHKILVVDDNVDAAETIAMLLEATGYEVHVEHDAKRALQRTVEEKPNICLLDIGLPEMNGHELARQIRKLPGMADAVLIALTGYGQEDDRANTRAAGFDHHFVKPVDTTELALVLARTKSN